MSNKLTYKGTVDGKEREIVVLKPNRQQQQEGQKVYNRAFNDAISSGALLRRKLDDFMKQQGLWDEDKQVKREELLKQIRSQEKRLLEGGFDIMEAYELASKRLPELRQEFNKLNATRNELDIHTAEGQAENAQFNYWVSTCLVYNDTQKPVFKSVDDYYEKSDQDYAVAGAAKLALLMWDIAEDFAATLPENQFLKEQGFVDEKGRLVNDDGKLVDLKGRLIDDQGRFINEAGEFVDLNGDRVDENGNLIVEKKPFTGEKRKAE